MKKELLLCLLILTSVVTFVTPTPTASAQTPVTFLWSIDMNVYDVAVSNDGKYMAATGWYEEVDCLLYFDTTDPEPIWNCSGEGLDFDGVAISADGSEVVVGVSSTGSGFLMYFNESWSRTGNQLYNWTWATYGLGGDIERDCLDMSDDGDYVVAGGTGWSVYYYANCTNSTLRYTANEDTTWGESTEDEVVTLDLSSNGRFLVVGTRDWSYGNGSVLYYKDAWNYDPGVTPDLKWTFDDAYDFVYDVSVSDDGYSVAMVDEHNFYYWANALTLNDGADNEPYPTWGTDEDEFRDVDLSSDGNEVFIGSAYYDTVYFMSDARTKIEYVPHEDFTWQALSDCYVYEVALSDDGQIAVATAESCGPAGCEYYAFFYKSNGDVIGSYQVADEEYEIPTSLSMSGDGGIVAIGTEYDSDLYVFQVVTSYDFKYFSVTPELYNSYLVEEIYPLNAPRKVSVYVEVEPNGTELGDQFLVFATLFQNGTWKVLANDYYIINGTEDSVNSMPEVLLIWDQLPVAEGMQIWVIRTASEEGGDSETLTFQVTIHDFGEDKLDLILQMLNDPNTGLAEIKNEIRDIEDYVDNINSYYWDLRDQILKINNTIVNRLYWMSDNYTVSLTNITDMLETIYDRLGIPVVGGLLVPLQIPFFIMAVAPYLAAILAGILALLFLARRMGR